MPNYKTHSIHGNIVLSNMDKEIDINIDDMINYSIGPDALLTTNYKLFSKQHINSVRDYFTYLINYIKFNRLQEDKEVMAFLYGQIDHYILDVITHPMIYYYTSNLITDYKFNTHGLIEHWIDDYVISILNNDNIEYNNHIVIHDNLSKLINNIYLDIFNYKFVSLQYFIGLKNTFKYDNIIRDKYSYLFKPIIDIANIGNITYGDNYLNVLPYLNINNDLWLNPETNEKYYTSFNDLWYKSISESLETLNDINNYLYHDIPFYNYYIDNDISYNTGLPCKMGQSLKYSKKY